MGISYSEQERKRREMKPALPRLFKGKGLPGIYVPKNRDEETQRLADENAKRVGLNYWKNYIGH